MPHFTLKQLKYFIAVVECQSIAEASRQQHIAQPSISIAIKTLEEMFGQQFFIRHHAQGVSITPSGQRFYEKARTLLQQVWQFEQSSRADNDPAAGVVSIGCSETLAPLYMPRLMAGFKNRHPQITLNVYDGEQCAIAHGLQQGRFDLAFLYDLDLEGSFGKEYLNVAEKPYALLPESHPLASRSTVSLEALSRLPMILLDVEPGKNYFTNLFLERGYAPQIAYRSPSIEMIRSLVGRGLGFSLLLTRPAVPVTYDGQRVKYVEILDEIKTSRLTMIRLCHSEPTGPTGLFMEYCRTADLR